MSKYRNLLVKKGTFYQKSKTPQDGYKEITLMDGSKTYHQEIGTVEGVLDRVNIYKGNYGSELRFSIKDGQFINVVQIPVKNQFGSVNDYIRSVVQILENLEQGKEYKVFVNNSKKNKKGIPYKALVFLTPENKLVDWAIQPNDFPKLVVTEDAMGEKKYDRSELDSFLTTKLVQGVDKVSKTDATAINGSDSSSNDKTLEAVEISPTDVDDLPF